ncbi:MAG: hypothetical protein IJ092_01645 [Atopobiaceae bacterium]|nr:hypothetical protein [Atopobiaceae bacterium]
MANLKEQIAKIEALAKEDEAFRDEYIAAIKAQDADKLVAFLTSKGFEVDADDVDFSGQELDEDELQNVAGGDNRWEKVGDYCEESGAFLCGLGLFVAFWSPDYSSD